MSSKELNRLQTLSRVLERRMTQAQAAEQLGLGLRQVERMYHKLRLEGAQGLVLDLAYRPPRARHCDVDPADSDPAITAFVERLVRKVRT